MKKLISLLLAVCVAFACIACGSTAVDTTAAQSDAQQSSSTAINPADSEVFPTDQPEASSAGRILVAYFSATGNTRSVAEIIAQQLDADIYEIVPAQAYTSDDLNYSNSSSRSTIEQNDDSARPALADSSLDISQYDIILLGYPIWWGQAPKIIYTFLESYDFSGKTIAAFCTSSSSGLGSSASNLEPSAPGASWLEGRRFASSASSVSVNEWLSDVGLT